MAKPRVGILFGGKSAEHEVSIMSAKSIVNAIDRTKYDVLLIGIDKSGRWFLNEEGQRLLEGQQSIPNAKSDSEVVLVHEGDRSRLIQYSKNRDIGEVDVVFPVLHGPLGEDGSVQGLLKIANIPFVGADVLGSAIGMDKDVMKRLLEHSGIPVAPFVVVEGKAGGYDYDELVERLGTTLFVKPANLGSSVGVSKTKNRGEFEEAVKEAFRYDEKIIIESFIEGREIECSVLGNENPLASVPGEIIPKHEFYSYQAKYIDENGAELIIPAQLEKETIARIQTMAIRAFKVLCCRGMARVDMFLTGEGEIKVNELNTIPGFTDISMYPKLWEESGMSFTELISRLIELAVESHTTRAGLKSSFD